MRASVFIFLSLVHKLDHMQCKLRAKGSHDYSNLQIFKDETTLFLHRAF